MQDAYKSIREALSQAGTYNDRKVGSSFRKQEKLTDENVGEALKGMAGVMIGPDSVNGVLTASLSLSNIHVRMTSDFRYLSGYAMHRYRICTQRTGIR